MTRFFENTDHAANWASGHAPTDRRIRAQDEAHHNEAAPVAGATDQQDGATSMSVAMSTHGESGWDASLPSRDTTARAPRAPRAPRVQVLYFASCPHTPRALDLLRDVMRAEGVQSEVEMIAVETEEAAEQHQFYGSPTIRVDGEDVCPPPVGAAPTLACRLYPQPDRHMAPHPPAPDIADALRRAGLGGSSV